MLRRRVYNTRCMISHSPGYRTEEPEFYRCEVCGAVLVRVVPVGSQQLECQSAGSCCGKVLEKLVPCMDEMLSSEHEIKYCIFGGFDHNTIRVEVAEGYHSMKDTHHIEWIYLRTFQGGQMKYLRLKWESAALFSMSNDDAYVFCGRDICQMGWEHCQFQCKRGHVAFAYCSEHGLFRYQF